MANEDLSELKIDKSKATASPVKSKKRLYWVVAMLFVIAITFLYLKGVLKPTTTVEVATVSHIYPSQGLTLLNASGYVVAQRKAAVASKVTGRLVSLLVEEGSRVKEGEVIALLESEDVAAARDQAAANLNVARSNREQARAELHDATLLFNRNKELLSYEVVPQVSYDAAEARHKKALAAVAAAEAAVKASAAALQAARVSVEYTFIRAPFSAVVLTKNADVGDIVTPIGAAAEAKAAVVTIADMNSLQVEVDVSESNLEQVKIGQPCEIQLDAFPASRFRGVVHMIVPTADRTKATVMVKVRFVDRDSRILPEMSAKVAFLSRPVTPEEQKPRTALSPAAVVTRKGKKVVFVLRGDRARETPVMVGPRFGDMVEVLSGVAVGDRVVVKPPDGLKDGSRIKVAEK